MASVGGMDNGCLCGYVLADGLNLWWTENSRAGRDWYAIPVFDPVFCDFDFQYRYRAIPQEAQHISILKNKLQTQTLTRLGERHPSILIPPDTAKIPETMSWPWLYFRYSSSCSWYCPSVGMYDIILPFLFSFVFFLYLLTRLLPWLLSVSYFHPINRYPLLVCMYVCMLCPWLRFNIFFFFSLSFYFLFYFFKDLSGLYVFYIYQRRA